MVPSGDGEVVAISRDFTEQRRAEAEQQRLAAEQAALRRVATLVAGNAPPEEVFQTVTEEVCRLLGLRTRRAPPLRGCANVDDRRQVRRADRPLRARATSSSSSSARRCRCCKPELLPDRTTTSSSARAQPSCARSGSPAASACRSRSRARRGARSSSRSGRTRPCRSRPSAACRRSPSSSASRSRARSARDELAASRLRIVEASDTERRRIERNLHDGAQQRLVALSLGLRLAQGEAARVSRRGRASCSRSSRRSSRRRSPSCASSRRGSTRRCSPSAGSKRRSRCWPRGRRSRSRSTSACPSACPSPWRRPPTTPSPRRSRTSLKHAHADSATVRVECCRRASRRSRSRDNGVGGADADRGSGLRRPARPRRGARRRAVGRERPGPGHARAGRASRPFGQARRRSAGTHDAHLLLQRPRGLERPGRPPRRRLRRASSPRPASCSAAQSRADGGREVDCRGDELFSVFDEPARGRCAALEIQRVLHRARLAGRGARPRAHRSPLRRGRAVPATASSASTSTGRPGSARPRTAARSWPRRRPADGWA